MLLIPAGRALTFLVMGEVVVAGLVVGVASDVLTTTIRQMSSTAEPSISGSSNPGRGEKD